MVTTALFVFKFGWFGIALIVAVYLLATANYMSEPRTCDGVLQGDQSTLKPYCFDRRSSLLRKPLDDCPCLRSR
jgi:hypothetical protein